MLDEDCNKPCVKCNKNNCIYAIAACNIKEHICNSCGWTVYILKCSDESLYTGITNNLEKRIASHNKGIGSKYTRGRTPVTLIKSFIVASKSEALKLEYKIKQMSREDKLKYEI